MFFLHFVLALAMGLIFLHVCDLYDELSMFFCSQLVECLFIIIVVVCVIIIRVVHGIIVIIYALNNYMHDRLICIYDKYRIS